MIKATSMIAILLLISMWNYGVFNFTILIYILMIEMCCLKWIFLNEFHIAGHERLLGEILSCKTKLQYNSTC